MITKEEWKSFRGSSLIPDHIMISINGDACTCMAITWRNDCTVEEGFAQYRKKGEKNWKRCDARCRLFESDMDTSNIFSAHLTSLEPGTQYEYTCGSETNRSEIYSFFTADENSDEFSFLCLSDVQTGDAEPPADYSLLNEFVKGILEKHPEIKFILTAGDNTNCGQTDVQWTGFLEGMKGIMEHIPLMLAMGNHDDMGFSDYFKKTDKYYSEKATYFCSQLYGAYSENGPEEWETANYTFDYGNAHFAVIGTSGPLDVHEWLLDDLRCCDKTWKFGVQHFPICYSGCDLACDDMYPYMRDSMDMFDILFSGHEHSFARSYPRRNENLFDKPSEGTIHYNLGSGNKNPPGTRVLGKVWNTVVYNHEEDLSMYAIAKVSGKKLMLTSAVEDGRIVDMCVIDKETDTILPYSCAPIYNRTRLKFKGADLGICAAATPCECHDGVWYIPAAVLIQYIGGSAERLKGKVRLAAYNKRITFFENSDIALTDNGSKKLMHKVIRSCRGQLYISADDFCRSFGMHWSYFKRNNFISVEIDSEALLVPEQP